MVSGLGIDDNAGSGPATTISRAASTLSLIGFVPEPESPALASPQPRFFRGGVGAAWRPMGAAMSISTMGVIAVTCSLPQQQAEAIEGA